MSDKDSATATQEKPAEKAEKKEAPFNTDALKQSTVRFGRDAWDLFLEYDKEKSLEKMQQQKVAFQLTARSREGALALRQSLEQDEKISGITGKDNTIEFTATFAQIQKIIKRPEVHIVYGTRLD